jgi:hypothetical protein
MTQANFSVTESHGDRNDRHWRRQFVLAFRIIGDILRMDGRPAWPGTVRKIPGGPPMSSATSIASVASHRIDAIDPSYRN